MPKAFYWGVNKGYDYHDRIIVNKLIKRQFYELENTDYSGDNLNAKTFRKIEYLLMKHFSIRTVLLMDQISERAAILRDYYDLKVEIINFLA